MIKKTSGKYEVPALTQVYLDGEYYGIAQEVSTTIDYSHISSFESSHKLTTKINVEYHIKVVAKPMLHCTQFEVVKTADEVKLYVVSQTTQVGYDAAFKYAIPHYKKSKYSAKEYTAEVNEYWLTKSKIDEVKKKKYKHHWNPTPAADPGISKLPALKEQVKHPITGLTLDLQSAIIQLNDVQKWTREQIADWLETLDIDIRFGVKND